MIKEIVKILINQKEPYVLRIGDRRTAISIWDYPPDAFARSFIEKWASSRGIENYENTLGIVKSILKNPENSSFWERCKALRPIDNLNNDDDFLLEFRDRMRGFQDTHIIFEVAQYKGRIKQNIAEVEPIVQAIEKLLDDALREKNRGKALCLKRALDDFTETLNNYKKGLDEASLVSRSATKLTSETGLFKGLSKIVGVFHDWDIARPYLQASTYNLSLDNPYRHMIWAPVPFYYSVQEQWEKNKDKNQCIAIFDNYFDIYNVFSSIIDDPLFIKRKDVFFESLNSGKSGYYTAASSLLYSQTEGLLFDLAMDVDNYTFGSTQIKIFPDPDNLKKYINNAGNEKDLLSITSLLFDSEFVKFFWPGFLEYFSSDFYQDRCHLAHGEITSQLTESDFKTIMLFVITVLYIYKEFQDGGEAPVLSDCYNMQK